jgi:hypothetical protein
MKKNYILLIALFLGGVGMAQKNEGNIFRKGTDEYILFMARQDFFAGDYRSALNKYKDVEKRRANDAAVHFYIGECYYMMKSYKDALQELEKAKSINATATAEMSLVLGRTYHVNGMLDKAIEELNTYRKTIADKPKKISESEVDVEIAQCNTAKRLMAKPVNTSMKSLIEINSHYEDKGPVLTHGGKTMLFTSRRPSGKNPITATLGDFGYFDDIYQSRWNDTLGKWLAPEVLKKPINTLGYDACTGISADGSIMMIYRNDEIGEAVGGELYLTKLSSNGKWKKPERLPKPISSTYYEDGACISSDGKTLYFISERPKGLGRGDIYISKKTAEGWSEPVNIGAPVNTAFDENGLYLTPDGKTLFFCSNGPESMGFYDIFKTTLQDNGTWSSPVNIGFPLNSVDVETKFVMTHDKKTAYLSTVRDSGLGERDIMMADISNYDVMTGVNIPIAPSVATLTGKISGSDTLSISTEIRVIDKNTGTQITMTKSTSDGVYSIEIPSNKTFIIEVAPEGYQKFTSDINLPKGKTEQKDIVLQKNN